MPQFNRTIETIEHVNSFLEFSLATKTTVTMI